MEEKKEKTQNNKKVKIILLSILLCIVVISIGCIICFNYPKEKEDNYIKEIQEFISSNENKTEDEEETINERVNKFVEFQEINSDIKGWLEIEDTKINNPILQTVDNDYYVNRDYKKDWSSSGSIILHMDSDINDNNSNVILYGHNMNNGDMFNNLLNYKDESYYNDHKEIRLITENEERKYEVIAAFKSRVFYKDEKNVFRYYNYINFENEDMYNEYISNIDKIKLYETELTARYGEQLLTMITCEYSQENGRMVVVAKRVE